MTREAGAHVEPDLKSGFIVNGTQNENSWSTEIQSVLTEIRDGKARAMYLSHQCRAENLPFSSGYLGGRRGIFQTDHAIEFLTFTRENAFHQIPDIDSVVPASYVKGLTAEWDGGSFFSQEVTSPDWSSEVVMRDQPIRRLGFDEVLEGLVGKNIPMRDLFLRVEWSNAGIDYRIHCPCRYINFSNPDRESRRYIQPISGYVLVPYGDIHTRGFVACAEDDRGSVFIELLTMRYHSPYGKLVGAVTGEENAQASEKFREILPAVSRSFDVVQRVEGRFDLFVYEESPEPAEREPA